MTDPKPIVPVNPAGLDEVAKSLLEGDPNPPPSASSGGSNIRNAENYVILPGKAHGNYSYPDLVVAVEKTHMSTNWNQAHEALHRENAFMLTLRQYIDFLQMLKSRTVYDGRGTRLASGKVDEILDEILTKREPWRAEWLDAYFKDVNGGLNISYDHRIINGQLKPQRTEPLESCVMEDAYINLFSANRQGLPTSKTRTQETYFWHPKDGRVARFGANSDGVDLVADWGPADSDSSLGVRVARRK